MNDPMIGPAPPWIEAIGWMLLHSLWQAAGVALALAVVLCVLRRAPATARYLAACAAMITIVALPVATLTRSDAFHRLREFRRGATLGPAIARSVMSGAPGPISEPEPAGIRVIDRLDPMLPAIVALWLTGVGGFSLRLLGGWVQARRWATHRTRPLADPWPDRVERLKQRLGLRRAVAILESARVEVPMVVGWIRPAILVPLAALSGLSVPELEAILAHELAHIRRHDYLVNLIQCVVEVLMFHHPAAWWISRVIRREREACCDDLAVAICRDRLTYARALAAMEGLRGPAFSPSPAANGGILLARVRRILVPQEESMSPVRILAVLAVVLAAAPLWLAHADADQQAPAGAADLVTQVEPNHAGVHFFHLPAGAADLVTQVEQAPTGRFLIGLGPQSAGSPARQKQEPALPANAEKPGPVEPDATSRCLDPPSEAEVLAKLPKAPKDRAAFYDVKRNNVRIMIEQIAAKADPVKVYPLAGACQLIHCHYKCTVYYDEVYDSAYPIPFHHVDHKVEVVYIDKDHLRRAPRPGPASQDRVDDRPASRAKSVTRSGKLPEAPIAEVRFKGNTTIPPEKIKVKLLSKAGQPFDSQKIEADVRSLMRTNWFSQVDAYQEESPPASGQHALIFTVREMPNLTHVEFRGRKAIRLKEIEDTTLLKKGNIANPTRTRNAVHTILRLYQDKGYNWAEVKLIEGGNPGDTKVVIQIFEGPRSRIDRIHFVGCQFATPAILSTRIASRPATPGLPGKYDRDLLDENRQKLLDYYQGLGFFKVQVTPVTRSGANPGEIELTFVIQEGPRYSVRKLIIEGNRKIKTEALTADLELHSGRPYLASVRDADKRRILTKYNEIGCIHTEVSVEPRFTGQPGVVDLLYKINEGEPYLLGELWIQGNDRTKDKVIRHEAIQARLLPNEVLDSNRIEIFKRRLMGLGYFRARPGEAGEVDPGGVRAAPRSEGHGRFGCLEEPVTSASAEDGAAVPSARSTGRCFPC
jgi:beta-lactamase regulating signal transducer with metallopeptidase domain